MSKKKRRARIQRSENQTQEPLVAADSSENMTAGQVGDLFAASARMLTLAAGIAILMMFATVVLQDGLSAVKAIGGFVSDQVSERTAQWMLALDTVFPIFYASGLALLLTGLQTRGNRPLVRLVLTGLLIAVIADFVENGLVYSAITGTGEISPVLFSITLVKYGLLAVIGVAASTVLTGTGNLARFLRILLRYIFPVAIALLISGLGGEFVRVLIWFGFAGVLMLLGVYAQGLSGRG